MLSILESLPDGLLDLPATELYTVLPGPTLIHLPGRREPALFVAILLHGNEVTGWEVMRTLLQRYQNQELPRRLSLLIGNVAAARHRRRRLEQQPDYNRIWSGGDTPEHAAMRQVLETMRRRGVFASIDIHNNAGINPYYACVNQVDHRFLQLARRFSPTIVYFTRPEGAQSLAFAELCPSVVLECGQPGDQAGMSRAIEHLDECLKLAEIPSEPVSADDIDVFHTIAVVKIPKERSFGFGHGEWDIQFAEQIDRFNFRDVPLGTELASIRSESNSILDVKEVSGRDALDRFFAIENNTLRAAAPLIPSMLSTNVDLIRQDCLCYLMERYPL